jgi:hypothetical protein
MGQTLLRTLSQLLEDAPPPTSSGPSGAGGSLATQGAGVAGRRDGVAVANSNMAGTAGPSRPPPKAFLLGHVPLSEVGCAASGALLGRAQLALVHK